MRLRGRGGGLPRHAHRNNHLREITPQPAIVRHGRISHTAGSASSFAWRDEDPEYRAERKNDRVVFRKIRREQLKNRKTARIIRGLFLSPLWAPRMTGKSAESWRRKYNGWRKKWDAVQAKKCLSEACKHGAKRTREKFFRETFLSYPPPTAMVPSAERKTKMTPTEKLSTGPSRACAGGLDVNGNTGIPVAPPRPRAYACTWREACKAADYVLEHFGNPLRDRGIWVWYCQRLGLGLFLDLADEVISSARQHEIKWPVRAFHRHLKDALRAKGGAK